MFKKHTVLAFAELYTYNGTVDAAKTGMKKADIDKVGKQVDDQLLKSFAAYHLPDADQRDLTEYYLDRMQEKMDIQAKIKTASDTAPVVELSWNSIDGNKFAKMMQTDQGARIFQTELKCSIFLVYFLFQLCNSQFLFCIVCFINYSFTNKSLFFFLY